MQACELTGIEVSFHQESDLTVAMLEMYPGRATVKVPKATDAQELLDRIFVEARRLVNESL